jgi:hypothetical protein
LREREGGGERERGERRERERVRGEVIRGGGAGGEYM